LPEPASPFSAAPGGVRVHVRLTPGASRDSIGGVRADGDGGSALKVSVTAPPEGGKANDRLIRLLAKSWRVPKSDITIAGGLKDRRKTLLVKGGRDLLARLEGGLKHG